MTNEHWELLLRQLGEAIGEIVNDLKMNAGLYPKEIGLDKDQNIIIIMGEEEPEPQPIKIDGSKH